MNPLQYIHDKDIYYIVNKLHLMSLSNPLSTTPYIYKLIDNRSLSAPRFNDQRKIISHLKEKGIIEVVGVYGKQGKTTSLEKAWTISFRRFSKHMLDSNDPLLVYHGKLMLELEEAGMNKQSIESLTSLPLSIDSGYIWVHFEHHKLQINRDAFRSSQTPELFFEYLINVAQGKLITRDELPFRTHRSFEDLIIKAGFERKLRRFILLVSKNTIQLQPYIELNIKDSTAIYKQLIQIPENKNTYDKYLEGIE